MVSVKSKGDFKNFLNFASKMREQKYEKIVDKCAKLGVEALEKATPKDTGKTSKSWGYEILNSEGMTKIVWTNSNVTKWDMPIVLFIQYGHHTKNGTFIQGIDFINPALEPIFKMLGDNIWKEVTSY